MTHDNQTAESNMEVQLNGEGSSAQIVSRSVAKGNSRQVFHPKAVGNAGCHAHVQCDSIIMDHAEVSSIPETMPGIWMQRLYMRLQSEELMMSSL